MISSQRDTNGQLASGNTVARKHGHTRRDGYRSPTYIAWNGMIARCIYDSSTTDPRYRQIPIDPRWRSFENFLVDMGERPDGTTLDRKNNALGYTKSNCRWATPTEQARNRSTTKLTADNAQEILGRLEHGEREESVAARFHISRKTVSDIRNGRTWKELPPFQGRPPNVAGFGRWTPVTRDASASH